MLAAFASERSSLRFWELKWFLISMDARPTCHRRRVVGCGGGGSKTAAKKGSWLRLCVSFMYVFHLCIKTGWRGWGFASVRSWVRQSAARGRTRSERGRPPLARPLAVRTRAASGTRRARAAERTERDFSKGLFKRVAIFSNEDLNSPPPRQLGGRTRERRGLGGLVLTAPLV